MGLLDVYNIILQSSEKVYSQLGRGYSEQIYQKALSHELLAYNLTMDIERHLNVIYTDSLGIKHTLSSNRIDIFIHNNNSYGIGNIILELKATTKKSIDDLEKTQVEKYLKQLENEKTPIDLGIIINFSQNIENKIQYWTTIQLEGQS